MPAFKHAARLRQAARQPLSYMWWGLVRLRECRKSTYSSRCGSDRET